MTDDRAAIKLGHVLYMMAERGPWPTLDSELLKSILSDTSLPGLSEQLNNLIQWLAKNQAHFGEVAPISGRTEAAVGAMNSATLGFVCQHAIDIGLVQMSLQRFMSGEYSFGPASLTFKGWKYYDELQRGSISSRTAFMAMQFGDAVLDRTYRNYFKEAVSAAGFELKRLDEGQPAGLIDDRLRVEIRQSRFLIADLTHHNKGAYWEAGYAEGLGKPVIYTCRKDAFNTEGTHFDTNHHLTVMWDPDNLGGGRGETEGNH